jgi:hypothetical protein
MCAEAAGLSVKRLMFGEGAIKHLPNLTVHNAFPLGCTVKVQPSLQDLNV